MSETTNIVKEEFGIPRDDPRFEVLAIAIRKASSSGQFFYLQDVRMGISKARKKDPHASILAKQYVQNLPSYVSALVHSIEGPVDAVISPCSDHSGQAKPYRSGLCEKFPAAIDLTDRLTRINGKRSSDQPTLDEAVAQLRYVPTGDENKYQRLVIVDDNLHTGTTASAIILKLRNYGLPDDCDVIVAAPFWSTG